MRSLVAFFAVLLLISSCRGGDRPETATIPLDQVWAFNMPGTRDMRELEKRLWNPIAISLLADSPNWPKEGQAAKSGFAVHGTGQVALQAAYQIMVDGKQLRSQFHSKDKISITFFSYQFAIYVNLVSVERHGRDIEIQYRFVRPINKVQTAHLALIPLGKLPLGEYHVNIKQAPMVQELIDGGYSPIESHHLQKGWGRRFVCQPFSFSIIGGAGEKDE